MVAGERLPPFSVEAEEATVACCLVDEEALVGIQAIVRPRDFFREKNRWAYEACLTVYERGEAVNQITVSHELSRAGRLVDTSVAFLSQIVTNLPTPIGYEHYARIVTRDALYRRFISLAAWLTKEAYAGGADAAGLCQKALSLLEEQGDSPG